MKYSSLPQNENRLAGCGRKSKRQNQSNREGGKSQEFFLRERIVKTFGNLKARAGGRNVTILGVRMSFFMSLNTDH
jgi:hypothetical protein